MEGLDFICQKEGCTYSETKSCAFNNPPLTCPERLASIADLLAQPSLNEIIKDTVLSPPEEMERFSSSLSMTVRDAQKMMRNKYCKIVGILGVPGTGKTASLVSLYLLLAHSKLENFKFLDSKTVMALEEISKGARKWNTTHLPEQLTAHTELQDERIAGYLHLRLQRLADNCKIDLLLTDLPGEWTTTLIDTNRTDRLMFLKASERIWLTVSSEDIHRLTTRHHTIHRIKLLIERIKAFLGNAVPDMTIVITHSDKVASVKHYLSALNNIADGFTIKMVEIASFSANDEVAAGMGIQELIDDLVEKRQMNRPEFWPDLINNDTSARHMLKYDNNREAS